MLQTELLPLRDPNAGIRQRFGRLLRGLGPLGCVAASFIVLVLLAAILAPLIATHDPEVGSVARRFQGPSAEHWFGTDQAGRDLFSRIVWGARSSLIGAAAIVLITSVLGTGLALIASWRGGWVDALISRVLDVLFSFPNLLLAIILVAVFGKGLWPCVIALAVAYVPYTARVIRSVAMRERGMPYVRSPQLQGIGGPTIVIRHLVPNVAPQVLTGATINFGYAMIDLAALSFLGLGVQQPAADWGLMVATGKEALLQGHLAESFIAGGCIVLTVAAFGYLGERLGGRKAAGRTR
ncbi:ABC transporter permease [Leucobacter sp. M11]|uniref:ABC transporter permease n=1 Tax=Leucobacter sp. M11 TaxID=2993565 RepID=UPI002D7E6A84|nr:ABC transporter permease [Leucobacter sp. M11]MEB4615066.1 ABC transporter permease [Leucobacter sp. M11]